MEAGFALSKTFKKYREAARSCKHSEPNATKGVKFCWVSTGTYESGYKLQLACIRLLSTYTDKKSCRTRTIAAVKYILCRLVKCTRNLVYNMLYFSYSSNYA